MADIYNRKSCGVCPFPYRARTGDLTIGDLWGVKSLCPAFADKWGTSLVLVNTAKGSRLFERIAAQPQTGIMKLDYLKVRETAKPLYRHFYTHPGREAFFREIEEGNAFEHAVTKSSNVPYDVGIIGIWYNLNYGAVLTSYALYRVLASLGYKAVMIDAPASFRPAIPAIRDSLEKGRRFVERYCNVSERYDLQSENSQLNKLCNTFVVGSDQLWRSDAGRYSRGNGSFFMLDFADEDKGKIAYSTSFGESGFVGDALDEKLMKALLRRFDAVSVRESTGVQICRQHGIDAVVMPDLVFLCDRRVYDDMACLEKQETYPFIFAYILEPTVYKQTIMRNIAERLNKKLIIVEDKDPDYIKRPGTAKWFLEVCGELGIDEWLWYIKNADYVLTDSYHGFCFSLIFQKKFLCFTPRDGLTRFETVAEKVGLSERINYSGSCDAAMALLQKNIDYSGVARILEKDRNEAVNWLQGALASSGKEKGMMNQELEKYRTDSIISFTVKNLHRKINRQSSEERKRRQRENVNNRKLLLHLFLEERLHGKTIAIRGAGVHTRELLNILPKDIKVECIIADEITNKYNFSYPVITVKQLSEYDVDVVVISSYRYSEAMKADMRKQDKAYELFDLYEELALMGIVLEKEFYY